jgi:hypothetical protein
MLSAKTFLASCPGSSVTVSRPLACGNVIIHLGSDDSDGRRECPSRRDFGGGMPDGCSHALLQWPLFPAASLIRVHP